MLPGPQGKAPPKARDDADPIARPERPARTRVASSARRTEIVAAAIRVIARDGIRACTVSALELATNFARGHFTYHFDSKEEIISLAFATVASDWATNLIESTAGDSARARLESQVRAAVLWAQQRPQYFRCLMNFRVEMMRDPKAFPLAPGIRAQFLEAAAEFIRQGMREGDFRADLDPPFEARALFAIVDGFLMHAAMDVVFSPAAALPDRVWAVVADRLIAHRASD